MALFGKKKVNMNDEAFRPERLEHLENKGDLKVEKERNQHIFERFHAKRDAKYIQQQTKWKRRAGATLIAVLCVLGVLWLVSWLLVTIGDLVIDVAGEAGTKGITISEHADMSDPKLRLQAEQVREVTNITKDWLPADLDNEKDGSHNGRNYLAYTFYINNNGVEDLDYISTLKMTGVAKSADEAIRIMVYKNGKETVYGKVNLDGSDPVIADKKFDYTVPFKEVPIGEKGKQQEIIFQNKDNHLKVGDVDKYTIVTWIEGEDVECINDIMGGYCKMLWFINVDDAEV